MQAGVGRAGRRALRRFPLAPTACRALGVCDFGRVPSPTTPVRWAAVPDTDKEPEARSGRSHSW